MSTPDLFRLPLASAAMLSLAAAGSVGATTYQVATVPGLVNAIALANADPGPDVIVLAAGTYYTETLTITDDLTVRGGRWEGSELRAASTADIFRVTGGADAAFHDLSLRGASIGAGIRFQSSGHLEVGAALIQLCYAGIWIESGSATIVNSTIMRNTVGLDHEGNGPIELLNDTIVQNDVKGFGNYGGSSTVLNTILAGNSGGDCSSSPDTANNSIASDASCGAGFAITDPLLALLDDNGGPVRTLALQEGSPALDAGSGCVATDARGVPRPQGAACDIGAFERTPAVFEGWSETVDAGGSVTNDYEEDGATPQDPVETTVTHPLGGTVTLEEGPGSAGFGFIGQRVHIEVMPDATPADPLVILFLLDASVIPAGQNAQTIVVTKDGSVVPPCAGTGVADLDPCVSNREDLADGDAAITVLTSRASNWDFAPLPTAAASGPAASVAFSVSPNPIRGEALVRFSLPEAQSVYLSLLDVTGRRVAVLASGSLSAGSHTATLRTSQLQAGVYFIQLRGRNTQRTSPVVVTK